MSTVAALIEGVKQLSEAEKGEFLARFGEIDFEDAWDRQMDADAKAGRLDFLWEEAKREIAAGTTRPLDDLINDK